MTELYTPTQRLLQDEFNARGLADRVADTISADELADFHEAFISERNMFFLGTVDETGFPSCSYKGGAPGFVRVVDANTIVFPNYDGNGMFMSQGNIQATAKVGLLFINFEKPQRMRLRGTAKLLRDGPMLASYPGSMTVTEIAVEKVWLNCARYVHPMTPTELSTFLPRDDGSYKLAPWKRIDILQEVITDEERAEAAKLGLITAEEYAGMEARGEVR
ncbi:MAG: pyridoxamine 5'-phosphate oxidase family protein [Acidobacteriota bacterium]|nr:pyridoxamine 5'-phosphate oxidase family protein [Acidobacteriota bacterium]